MGSILACCAADMACCIGAAACKCCFSAFGLAASKATRLAYSFIFLLNSIVAWVMLSDWAIKWLTDRFNKYPFYRIECPEGLCYGTLATYRITCALVFFHLIMAFLTAGIRNSKNPRASIQNGFWAIKLGAYVLLIVACFYLPNEFFITYGSMAMIFSGIFILIQLVLLIDFAYRWSERCLEEYEYTDNKQWLAALALSTILLFIIVVVATGLLFGYFGNSQCQLNLFFVTTNLMLTIIVSLISIHPKVQEMNPQSGLPQSAVVSAYSTYLVFSALTNEPDVGCNPLISAEQPRITSIVVGALITFLALAYSTSATAVEGNTLMGNNAETIALLETDEDPASGGNAEDFDDEEDSVAYNYSFFHVVFAIASMYVAMLLTNWDSVEKTGGTVVIGESWQAVWVKVATSWMNYVLYGWTLLAPVVFPDREWG